MEALGPSRGGVCFGVFEADLRSGELRKQGVKVKLQEQPFRVLCLLLDRPGEVVTREELRQKLWPADTFVDFDTGLNSAIKKLREALGDSADNPRFVETLPRRGYRFIVPVASEGSGLPQASSAVQAQAGEGSSPRILAPPGPDVARPAGLSRRKVWAVAGAAVGALAVLLLLNVGGWRDRLLSRTGSPLVRSIAVLPLENLTGDPSQEYFADGMTDALITDLAQISSLRVISRTSVMQYKGARKPLPQIARELNVEAVVEGTVARSGDRVRINSQLIRAATEQHLWAESYERDRRDILTLESEVARAIVEQIRAKLTPQEQARLAPARPVNSEAYEAYLKGTYYWYKWTPEGVEKAIEYFQQAIQKDPNYAAAYSGLSMSYFFRVFLSPETPRDWMRKAEEAALKALELDGSLAEAHSSLARIRFRYHWDWAGSERESRRALELNPNYAEGRREYSVFLRTVGRFDESIAEAKKALELDPLRLLTNTDLGHSLHAARRYDEAIARYRQALELDPNFAFAHFLLGWVYDERGDLPHAITELEKAVSLLPGDPLYQASLAHTYALAGRRSEALRILGQLEKRSREHYVSPYDFALVHVGLGNTPQALDWLEKAYEVRAFELVSTYTEARFDSLRSEPRFQDLLRRMGMTPQSLARR